MKNLRLEIAARVLKSREFSTDPHRSSVFVLVNDGLVYQQGIAANPGRALRRMSQFSPELANTAEVWLCSLRLEKREFNAAEWNRNPIRVDRGEFHCAALCDKRLNVQKNRMFGDIARMADEYTDRNKHRSLYQSLLTGELVARTVSVRLKEKIEC